MKYKLCFEVLYKNTPFTSNIQPSKWSLFIWIGFLWFSILSEFKLFAELFVLLLLLFSCFDWSSLLKSNSIAYIMPCLRPINWSIIILMLIQLLLFFKFLSKNRIFSFPISQINTYVNDECCHVKREKIRWEKAISNIYFQISHALHTVNWRLHSMQAIPFRSYQL